MRLPFGVSLGLFSCRMPLYTKVGQGLLSNQPEFPLCPPGCSDDTIVGPGASAAPAPIARIVFAARRLLLPISQQ